MLRQIFCLPQSLLLNITGKARLAQSVKKRKKKHYCKGILKIIKIIKVMVTYICNRTRPREFKAALGNKVSVKSVWAI